MVRQWATRSAVGLGQAGGGSSLAAERPDRPHPGQGLWSWTVTTLWVSPGPAVVSADQRCQKRAARAMLRG